MSKCTVAKGMTQCDRTTGHIGDHESNTGARWSRLPGDADVQPIEVLEKVDHPAHYNAHPAGIECITIVEHMTFNAGNAVKYVWRAGLKSENPIEDLKKAAWYIAREIERLSK